MLKQIICEYLAISIYTNVHHRGCSLPATLFGGRDSEGVREEGGRKESEVGREGGVYV